MAVGHSEQSGILGWTLGQEKKVISGKTREIHTQRWESNPDLPSSLSSSVLSFTLGVLLSSSLTVLPSHSSVWSASLGSLTISLRPSLHQVPANPQRVKAIQEGFLPERAPGQQGVLKIRPNSL